MFSYEQYNILFRRLFINFDFAKTNNYQLKNNIKLIV